MKRIVAIIILIAFIGLVAFASLGRNKKTDKEKTPAKQEQKIDKKAEKKRPCLFG